MNKNSWLILILAVIWGLISWRWYTCGIKKSCETSEQTHSNTHSETHVYPISFQWGNGEAILGSDFNKFKADWLQKAGNEDTLIMNIWAYNNEGNCDSLLTLRKKSLLSHFTELNGRIKFLSVCKNEDVQYVNTKYEASEFGVEKGGGMIEELDDRIVIFFPTGSSQKIDNPAIDDYLKNLVDQNKNAHIELIGFADNTGTDEINLKLSEERALAIKEILIKDGINAENIKTNFMGSKNPIESNDTEKGRAKNRRVELKIIQ